MKLVLPRVIYGNRGDIASRWGVVNALSQLGGHQLTIFSEHRDELPGVPLQWYPYGKVRNLMLSGERWKAIKDADAILWSVGLDLQDDSSLAKLIYFWLLFHRFNLTKSRIISLFQGAGPITTKLGMVLSREVLKFVDLFVARDPGTANLIKQLAPNTNVIVGHDGIFLPGFEVAGPKSQYLGSVKHSGKKERPIIGLNMRQWFHLSSRLLPYQLMKTQYLKQSQKGMHSLTEAFEFLVRGLRYKINAEILLLSAYQPGSMSWEDDLPWLKNIKNKFFYDEHVRLIDTALTMPQYYSLISGLDLMVGMRLHSSLIALRLGVPAINLSYTLKGRDIYSHLGLADHVHDLDTIFQSPETIINDCESILNKYEAEVRITEAAVSNAVIKNTRLLESILTSSPVIQEA